MSKQNKIINFLKKNAFYLCLALCVLGAGLAVFFGMGAGDSKNIEEEPQQQVQAIQSPSPKPSPTVRPVQATPSPSVSPEVSASGEEPQKKPGSAKASLKMPIEGQITKAFSGETLVFNPTLNMWMTHNGVDIAGTGSSEVSAALAGEVTRVYADESRGNTVEIAHASGGVTVYAGLSEVGVNEGSLVNAGTVLGKVGTPGFEASAGEHLHFEYIVNGKFQDPAEFFR